MSDLTRFTVREEEAGERLDVFLMRMGEVSRNRAVARIRAGVVTLDDEVELRPGRKLRADDVIGWEPPEVVAWELLPEDIPLDIVYEDADLLVVNKPAGMVVHPAAGNLNGTLVNALLHHCHDLQGIGGVLRPGIVHRIDKDTSGLLVVAKHERAHLGLAEQFAVHSISRRYVALVYGRVNDAPRTIDTHIARHPVLRKRYAVGAEGRGKRAVTHLALTRNYAELALLSLTLETGRTHQLRVHLSHIGHPIVGDMTYGGDGRAAGLRDKVLMARLKPISRQFLHAAVLGFTHPVSGEALYFEAPLASDMADFLSWLDQHEATTR